MRSMIARAIALLPPTLVVAPLPPRSAIPLRWISSLYSRGRQLTPSEYEPC
jgi:hypothetical protein